MVDYHLPNLKLGDVVCPGHLQFQHSVRFSTGILHCNPEATRILIDSHMNVGGENCHTKEQSQSWQGSLDRLPMDLSQGQCK